MKIKVFYKKILFILILPFFWVNFCFSQEITLTNTGFIKSGLWYSKDPFFAGDKIRIYTIVYNGSEHELLGTIEFRDNENLICSGQVAIISERTQEFWCDWTALSGEHKIIAKIVNAKISPIGGTPQSIILENSISGISERTVKTAPIIEEKETEIIKTDLGQDFIASSSPMEEDIKNSLNSFQKNISVLVPDEIKKEDVVKTKDKVLSYVPNIVKENIEKIAEKTGLYKIQGPLSYFVDFFVAIYKFIINDPLVIIIILFFIFRYILKTIYNKITNMY